MSLLNTILGQVSENATVQNLAAKVGLSPEQAEQAIAASVKHTRSQAIPWKQHRKPPAFQPTSYRNCPAHRWRGIARQFASLLEGQGGAASLLGGLKNFL